MPEVISCASLEWGWKFWLPALIIVVLLLCVLAYLLIRAQSGHLIFNWDKFKVAATGDWPRMVVTILILVGLGWAILEGYKTIRDAYIVALTTPGRALEQVRDDFQGETHVLITVSDAAKKFTVVGNYRGACVTDLFETICRKYADKLACKSSAWDRTFTVDLKRP
jgi:hypothetical protein